MTREEGDCRPLVDPPSPENVLEWEAGKNKPASVLSFAKEHFWKHADTLTADGRTQSSAGGNFVAKCKRCGKGPCVFTTTRMKAHVAGQPYSKQNQIAECTAPCAYWQQHFYKEFQANERKRRAVTEGREGRLQNFREGLAQAAQQPGCSSHGEDMGDPADGGYDSQWQSATGQSAPQASSLSRVHSSRSSGSEPPRKRTKEELRFMNQVLCQGMLSAGIRPNALDDSYFREGLHMLAEFGPDFKLMNRKEYFTLYCPRVKQQLVKDLKKWQPNLELFGCTIATDGWKAVDNDKLMNSVSVSPQLGVKFERSTDVSGQVQDADLVEKEIQELIRQVGEDYVMLVVCDGASPCKAAMQRIEAEFEGLWCIRCMAHLTQLLFKDLQATAYFNCYIEVHKELVQFIMAHDFIWKRFLVNSAEFNGGSELRPIKYGETRYASWYRVVERNIALRRAYEATLGMPEVVNWVANQCETTRANFDIARQHVIEHHIETWSESEEMIQAFNQAYLLLKLFDGDTPCLGKVYNRISAILRLCCLLY